MALKFFRPQYFMCGYLLLTLLCLLLFIMWRANRCRPTFTNHSRYPLLGTSKFWLWILILATILVIALAGPCYQKFICKTHSNNIDIIIVLDHSLSMRARDAIPYRLQAAKREILKITKLVKQGDRVAFFTFAKNSHRHLYLCKDLQSFTRSVGNTNYAHELAQDESIWNTDFVLMLKHVYQSLERQQQFAQQFEQHPIKRNTIMLLFSDGDNNIVNNPNLAAILHEYRTRNIKIYSVGVGSKSGVLLTSVLWGYPQHKYPIYLQSQWRDKTTTLGVLSLKMLSRNTGGNFHHLCGSPAMQNFIQYAIDANRSHRLELNTNDDDLQLWWYLSLLGAIILLIAIILY